MAEGATVHVLTWGAAERRPALGLGAGSARVPYGTPPEPLDSATLFAPVGDLFRWPCGPSTWAERRRIAGIRLSDVPALRYGACGGTGGEQGHPRCAYCLVRQVCTSRV